MTKKQIIEIADAAYPDGLRFCVGNGDTLAKFILVELSETYEGRKPATYQLEAAYDDVLVAREDLELVARALEGRLQQAEDAEYQKQKDSKEKV